MFGENSSRRSFFKLLAAAPLLSHIAARNIYAHAATALGVDQAQNVYARLGVKTIINCRGTWTYLSGSLEFPEVRQAQEEAGHYFVNMIELQRAVGRRLSELTGAESSFPIFSGGCPTPGPFSTPFPTHVRTSFPGAICYSGACQE